MVQPAAEALQPRGGRGGEVVALGGSAEPERIDVVEEGLPGPVRHRSIVAQFAGLYTGERKWNTGPGAARAEDQRPTDPLDFPPDQPPGAGRSPSPERGGRGRRGGVPGGPPRDPG